MPGRSKIDLLVSSFSSLPFKSLRCRVSIFFIQTMNQHPFDCIPMKLCLNARLPIVVSSGARLLLLLLFVFCCRPAAGVAEVIDRVIAEVNDDVITLSELEEEGRALFQRVAREAPADERDEALRQLRTQLLNNLIDKKLIAQEAAKQGITVAPEEVDAAFEQVLLNNRLDRQAFVDQLAQSGMNEQIYRSNLESQLLQNKLLMRDVHAKILITDEMVLDYYNNEYTKTVDEGNFYLLQIGIGWGSNETEPQATAELYEAKLAARKRAERVHSLAQGGQDFRELARRFSDLPSAAEGGDIGLFTEGEMAGYMRDAVIDLQPGEISSIVETPFGFQFFQLLSGGTGGIVMHAPYDSVKEDIRELLFREAMQKHYESWVKRLRDSAYIRK